jgi:5-methyltetrahydropteroyltriglutamate--homocysteine methyltransferase
MKRSVERMLTTHVGSLPRPAKLVEAARAKMENRPVDEAGFASLVAQAVGDVVRRQAEIGIDIVADGEMGKAGFIPYVNERLQGFEPAKQADGGSYWGHSREVKAFPEFYEWASRQSGTAGNVGASRWVCTGPIRYRGGAMLARDIENLRHALQRVKVEEAFVPSISPTNVEDWNRNAYYKSDEEYLFAIADAMHDEYKAIVDAGFVLPIDDPALATYYVLHPEASIEQCRKWAGAHVDALNHALRGIPPDKVRYHTCYSINMGPRVHEMELKDLVDVMLRIDAGAYSFEYGNPRHEHEWRVWESVKLPPGKIVIPGFITHSTNVVEHPQLVAERIERFARLVGRENVIAGADCGFASFATSLEIHPSVVWAKFEALVEGARIATKALWGRA